MEVEDGGGDTDDLWLSLHAAGYDDGLQLAQVRCLGVDDDDDDGVVLDGDDGRREMFTGGPLHGRGVE